MNWRNLRNVDEFDLFRVGYLLPFLINGMGVFLIAFFAFDLHLRHELLT